MSKEEISKIKRETAEEIVKMINDLPREEGEFYVDTYIATLIKEKYGL